MNEDGERDEKGTAPNDSTHQIMDSRSTESRNIEDHKQAQSNV